MALFSTHQLCEYILLLLAVLAVGAKSQCPDDSTSYDFIIVGGGTAGLALASRLSQGLLDECILLIEAGPYASNEPGFNVPGLNNRILTQPRGRVLGGSSALNLMSWDRGAVADYDAWEVLGNLGWNWKRFIAAMLKVETLVGADDQYQNEKVRQNGPIQTLVNRFIPPQEQGFVPAMQSLGVRLNLESLNGDPLGVMNNHRSNIREFNYTRSYAVEYLWQAGSNLQVWDNTTISRIKFSNTSNAGRLVASGVSIDGQLITARKEVILSAGTLLSPRLLELSGVGDAAILTDAGVTPLINLSAVGSNLQDHIRIQNSYRLKPNYTISLDDLRTNATYAAQQLSLWEARKLSAYDYTATDYAYLTWLQVSGNSSSDLVELAKQSSGPNDIIDQRKLAYLATSLSSQVAGLEIILSDGYNGVKGTPAATSPDHCARFFSLLAVVMHPFSRGSVHINSTNPTGKPVINPNYASRPFDIRAIIEATKYSRKIASSPSLAKTWTYEYEPGLNVTDSEVAWEQFARNTALTIYHPIGTCAMLPLSDGGVVSPDLVVYGTQNLRVVDASVIPILPSGHIQTMVYAIAEIAADIMVKEYS